MKTDRETLTHRIMSGSLIVAVLILTANNVPAIGGWVVLVAVCALAQLEFYKLLRLPGIPVYRYLGVFCGASMVTATFFTMGPSHAHVMSAYDWENLVLLASLVLVFARQFLQKENDRPLATIACTLLGILYIPYLFNYFTRLAFSWEGAPSAARVGRTGRQLIFYLVLVVKSTDIGAFFVGTAIGKHRLLPRLSPRKTWEGLAGGFACAVIASIAFVRAVDGDFGHLSVGMGDALILGVLLALAGTAGDLFESLVKRASGTKDSGSVVPGMGGILDVLDSLLFGVPVLYFYARIFLA